MIGRIGIRSSDFYASRIHDAAVARAVEDVDQDEAINGSIFSDGLRLGTRKAEQQDQAVPFSVYLSRAAQFRSQLPVKKTDEGKEAKTSKCPIDKARAESTTGDNAPLNWLVADHFGGEWSSNQNSDNVVSIENKAGLDSSAEQFSAQPKLAQAPTSLMADEWLLSPCA